MKEKFNIGRGLLKPIVNIFPRWNIWRNRHNPNGMGKHQIYDPEVIKRHMRAIAGEDAERDYFNIWTGKDQSPDAEAIRNHLNEKLRGTATFKQRSDEAAERRRNRTEELRETFGAKTPPFGVYSLEPERDMSQLQPEDHEFLEQLRRSYTEPAPQRRRTDGMAGKGQLLTREQISDFEGDELNIKLVPLENHSVSKGTLRGVSELPTEGQQGDRYSVLSADGILSVFEWQTDGQYWLDVGGNTEFERKPAFINTIPGLEDMPNVTGDLGEQVAGAKMGMTYEEVLAELNPESVLGKDYGGTSFMWDHVDDKFVPFQVLEHLAVTDPTFLMAYINNTLRPEEREQYPTFFYPCFVEKEQLHLACMSAPFQIADQREELHVLIVMHQKVMGVLIATQDIRDQVVRGTVVQEEVSEDDPYYHLQFQRFSPEVMEKLGLNEVEEWYRFRNQFNEPLQVNFAQFQHISEEEEQA